MNARVNFIADNSANTQTASTGRILVPKQAVVRKDNATFVFVIKGDKVEQRAIRPGGEIGEDYHVLEGLSGNELVALNGVDKLRDGDRVKVQ